LTVIGPSERAFDEIKSWARSHEHILLNLMGVQSQAFVFKKMFEADIFCVPSHREALGVANLEALARGVPVIGTSVGGIPEVLANGNAGWLVPVGDYVVLANTIRECIENDNLRIEKIEYGLMHVKKFKLENM